MKLFYVVGFISLISVLASAANAISPKVTCELMYHKVEQGIAIDFKRGSLVTVVEGGTESVNSGFKMTGDLRQICATDGGPCFGAYDLSVTIEKGNAKSYLMVAVKKDPTGGSRRYSTALDVGNESGFVNCDIE